MKIEKIHGGKYRVRKTCKGTLHIVTFDHKPTQKEVMIALAEKLADSSEGEKGSFEMYAKRYIESRKSVVSPSTVRTYNTKLSQLSEDFKKMNIYDITCEAVQTEINSMSEEYEPKTVKTTHGFIASVLGAYRPNLRLKTKLPQAIQKDEYTPSSDDIKRILAEVKGTPYSVAFQLGVWGCRRGEICALSIDDLDENSLRIHKNLVYDENKKWVIKENPKTDESNRSLPLPQELADEIKEQGYIYNGHPNALNKALRRTQDKLGIPHFTFHDLRSHFASYAHSLGICEQDILSIGGWKTPSVMRKVYRKSMEESKKEAMDKISKALFGGDAEKISHAVQ